MIFLTSRKIFQTVFVLNSDNDPSARCQMLLQNFQEIFIRCAAAYVSLAVLEDTDEADIVIICGQIRFHIRKIAYVDRHIFTFTVPVRIDQTALFREIHTGHRFGFPGQGSCNGSAAAAYFQHFVCLFDREKIHDIFPQSRQMIQDRPAFSLCDDPVIFHGTVFFYNLQDLVFYTAVTIIILSGILIQIQCYFADGLCHSLFLLRIPHFRVGIHIIIAYGVFIGYYRNIQGIIQSVIDLKGILIVPRHSQRQQILAAL